MGTWRGDKFRLGRKRASREMGCETEGGGGRSLKDWADAVHHATWSGIRRQRGTPEHLHLSVKHTCQIWTSVKKNLNVIIQLIMIWQHTLLFSLRHIHDKCEIKKNCKLQISKEIKIIINTQINKLLVFFFFWKSSMGAKKKDFKMVVNDLWNPAVCLIEAIFPNSAIERWRASSLNSSAGWSGLGRLQKRRKKEKGGEWRRGKATGLTLQHQCQPNNSWNTWEPH